ncbi:MAG: hypothetical protein ACK5MK_12530 [Dysgonomonas sp.]
MKKIFLLLMACTLLAACDHDDNTSVVPEKPYFNPVEGKWAIDLIIDSDRDILVFTKEFHKYLYSFRNNKYSKKKDEGKYTVTENKLYFENNISADYSISNDTLILNVKSGTIEQIQKYIKTNETLPE